LKNIQKKYGVDTKKMTPDWAPNRIKFRDKILPFYHENMLQLENMEQDVYMMN
jgi:hypothetical protein